MIKLAFAALVLTTLASCSFATPNPPDRLKTITEIVVESASNKDKPEFTILLAALENADPSIAPALNERWRRATVFAPTDAAFADLLKALDITSEELLQNRGLLNAVLAYHVVPCVDFDGKTLAEANGGLIASLLPDHPHKISTSGSRLKIDDAQILTADVRAANGVIHVIDKVLVPADAFELAPTLDTFVVPDLLKRQQYSIADVLEKAGKASPPEFTILRAAISGADRELVIKEGNDRVNVNLSERMQSQGFYTVFAPTNAAFTAADLNIEDLLMDTDLGGLLRHHILPGLWTTQTLEKHATEHGVDVLTMAGDLVNVQVKAGNLYLDGAKLSSVDQQVGNGYLSVIDKVLLPPR